MESTEKRQRWQQSIREIWDFFTEAFSKEEETAQVKHNTEYWL